MKHVLIYGASDDLVEVEGDIEGADEYGAHNGWVGRLEAPDGDAVIIRAEFGKRGCEADWTLSVENTGTFPGWPITFTTRPDRDSDPGLIIEVPEGTRMLVEPPLSDNPMNDQDAGLSLEQKAELADIQARYLAAANKTLRDVREVLHDGRHAAVARRALRIIEDHERRLP